MNMPRSPPAQTVPVASSFEYPYLSIMGKAKRPMATTEAPIMPVQAANKVQTSIVAIASPPFTGPAR